MATKKSGKDGPRTSAYDHPNRKRAVIPSAQDALVDEDVRQARVYAPAVRTPDDEPRLAWVRGNGSAGESTPQVSLPLYVREEINPAVFVAGLTGAGSQSAFGGMGYTYEDLPDDPEARYQWYEHRQNWRNRLIHGESEAVMTSLLDRENMSGKVQMIFFDPPFGIKYNSNFQPDQRSTDVKDGQSEGRPQGDVRTIKAFRDTWENGVHSYFDSILDKLHLFRELLTDSGSLFFQIGDENVHRVGLLCDEVFGAENRVTTITFVTTGGSSAKTLPDVSNYMLWYAKNIRQIKYQQIYEEQNTEERMEMVTFAAGVEFPKGHPQAGSRALTSEERAGDWRKFSKVARLFTMSRTTSQGPSDTGRSEPYHWREMARSIDCPAGSQWRVSHEGLDRLAEKNRLHQNRPDGALHLKWYFDEMPGRRINNIWHRTSATSDKRYVVQTSDKIVERCILMSTNPGDLILDPTCGGATTATMAEKWGRRWITMDVSPVAISLARQRVATGVYPYYTVAGTAEGIAADAQMWRESGDIERAHKVSAQEPWITGPAERNPEHGFVYQRVPYVSAKVLAYDEEPPPTLLVDRPHETKRRGKRKVLRVASPFTVESHTAFTFSGFAEGHQSSEDQPQPLAVGDDDYANLLTEKLLVSPIRSGSSGHPDIQVRALHEWPGDRFLTHKVTYTVGGKSKEREGGLVILPEDAPATAETLRAAATEVARQIHDADLAIAVANEFDPDASQEQFGKVRVLRVVPHRDLAIGGLKDDSDFDLFVALGQPDIHWQEEEGGRISLDVRGWDAYNPKTGLVEDGGAKSISCIMVDTDYNGRDFFARLMHFPGAGQDRLVKNLRKELKATLDEDHWEAMLSTATAPFPAPSSGRVAVKIVTTRGLEMTRALDVTQGPPRPPAEKPTQPDPVEADPLVADRQRLCERIGRLAEFLRDREGALDWAADTAENLRHGAATVTTSEQLADFRDLTDQLEATIQPLLD